MAWGFGEHSLTGQKPEPAEIRRRASIQKRAIISHVLIILDQLDQGTAIGQEAKTTCKRSMVVNQLSLQIIFHEENILMIGHSYPQHFVRYLEHIAF